MSMIFTKDNWKAEVIEEADKLVVVDLHASWCGPCRLMSPTVDKLADELTSVKVGKLSVEDHGEIATQYNVFSIPTLLFFKGGKEVKRLVGLQSEAELRKTIEGLE